METDWKKKYEEALKKVELLRGYSVEGNEKINELFPELAESKDEKIRKGLVKLLTVASEAYLVESTGIKKDSYLAYLEKQKEQKPEWSEEDDAHLKWLCEIVHSRVVNKKMSLAEESELGNWMDKWLNHKPQSHWKPSAEQMAALLSELPVVKGSGDKAQNILESLYEDLKKLM